MGCKNGLKILTENVKKSHPELELEVNAIGGSGPRVMDVIVVDGGKEHHLHSKPKDGNIKKDNIDALMAKIAKLI